MDSTQKGMVFSAAFHVAVLLLVVFGLPRLPQHEIETPPVTPVDFVEIADVTAAPKLPEPPAPEPQKPEPVPEVKPAPPPPPAPAPEAAPPPPEEKPAPPEPKPEPKPEPPKPPQDEVKITPRAKPAPPQKAFDPNRIAALLDKRPDTAPTPEPDKKNPNQKPLKALEAKNRSPLDAAKATADLQTALRSQIEPCWNVPAGARDAENLKVRIQVELRPDGSLARMPEIIDSGRMSDDFYRTAAESARRAVQKCTPVKLPPDDYDLWRSSVLTFDPKEMVGG